MEDARTSQVLVVYGDGDLADRSKARLGAILREVRKGQRLSARQVAEKVEGLSTSYVSMIERGERISTIYKLAELMKALGLRPEIISGDRVIYVPVDRLEPPLDLYVHVREPEVLDVFEYTSTEVDADKQSKIGEIAYLLVTHPNIVDEVLDVARSRSLEIDAALDAIDEDGDFYRGR